MSERLVRSTLLIALVSCAGAVAAGTLHDPLRPPAVFSNPVAATRSAPSWQLASTLVAGDQRSAVINGRVLGLGDRVDGAEVVDIQPGAVRLRRSDREFLVELERRGIKQEPRP